jgi:hypothetical protein
MGVMMPYCELRAGADMWQFLRSQICAFIVKLMRAICALLLDAVVALAVVGIARVLGLLTVKMLGSEPVLHDLQMVHRLIIVITVLAYGGWGLWDGIESFRRPTVPPCSPPPP